MSNFLNSFQSFNAIHSIAIILCYYGSWSSYRSGDGKFSTDNIDPFLCTHLVYAFFGLSPNGSIQSLDSYLDFTLGFVENFNLLKSQNPSLKTLAAVGGWNQGSGLYSTVAASPTLRKNFIDSSIAFLENYGFDGIDLDWEYPAQRDSVNPSSDKANFVTWLQEIKDAFQSYGYMLTIAVAAAESSASLSYNIPEISEQVDYISLMTYDLHGSWNWLTGINAPLYSTDGFNVDACVTYWLQQGAPPSKLLLGVPFYGRTFTLENEANNGIGVPTLGPGNAGEYTKESGFLAYYEICTGSWNHVWSNEQSVPYAYSGNQWVGYDNPESIRLKVEYMSSKGLAGIMIWSIETDDFLGKCGSVNPLLNVINDGNVVTQTSSTASTTTITSTSTPSTTSTTPTTTTRATSTSTTTPTTTTSTTTTPAITTTTPSTTTPATTTTTPSTTPATTTTTPSTTPAITTTTPSTTQTTTKLSTSTTTEEPSTTKKVVTPANVNYTRIDCDALGEGFYRDPYDWSLFYKCEDGQQFYFLCQTGMLFDDVNKVCDYYYLVDPSLPITTISSQETTNTPRIIPFIDIGCGTLPEGFYRDPDDCSIYRVCTKGEQYDFYCQEGLYFDTKKEVCNFDYIVDC